MEQAAQDPPAKPEPEETTEMPQVIEVNSLDDLKDVPVQAPEPIEVVWTQGNRLLRMKVVVKRPTDYEGFPVAYMQTKREAETPAWKDKVKTYPHEGAHNKLLRNETIVSPEFLKDEGIEKSGKLDPDFFAQLHRRLMLIAGVDGDFFADWAQMRMPKASVLRLAESLATSEGSSPTKSSPAAAPPPVVSMPAASPTTTESPGKETSPTEPSDSKTTSGSVSQPQASPAPASPRRRTLSSDSSSASPQLAKARSA